MQSSSGVWQRVFHALVRDGLMQRTAARVGCVGGLEMQSRPLILGYVCEAGGLRGAVLCRAAAGKQPRTDTPAGPEAEMCPQSPWCCIQGWWGVWFVQLCGIHQPDDSERHRQGAGGHRHGAQAGRAGGALAHCGAGQAPNRARRCALCPAVDWAPPTGGCRVSYSPHARWQMAAALATAGGRLVGGPERPQEPFITKARHSTPKPTAES